MALPLGGAIGSFYGSGDFDGDQRSDALVLNYYPSGLAWMSRLSTTLAFQGRWWGVSGDVPAPGDYDGDGRTDNAIFRPGDGTWWLWRSGLGGLSLSWGLPGDVPVAADYDRDGWTDPAVWRPASGFWAVLQSSRGASSALDDIIWKQWGLTGDFPMAGDYDGDSRADLTVWRPSNGYWFICPSQWRYDCAGHGVAIQWGLPGDVPVRGDFDGDGRLDPAVWRPTNGTWYIRHSSDNDVEAVQWGLPGDVPLCGAASYH